MIPHLLPELTYEALLAAMPPDTCFSQRDSVKQNLRPTRERLVPDFTGAMWAFMEDDVIAGVMVPSLVERFLPSIADAYAQRCGDRAAAVTALEHRANAGRLMLRRPGYHPDPHLDPRRVIIACLLYLARPGDSPAFGTQHFSLDAVPANTGSKTYYPGEFGIQSTVSKTVAFTPNTALLFLNAGAAAHGATIPSDAPSGTKRFTYQHYISPDPAALEATTGERESEQGN